MTDPVAMAELWRGGRLESQHYGHAVIVDAAGEVVQAWGDPNVTIYPRSSCKMLQALPLVESGAARDLTPEHLALACASHQGSAVHVGKVGRWLADLGLTDHDLRCGSHEPYDRAERERMIRDHAAPSQMHNNCSGKHTGFLTLNRHLGGSAEYVDPEHPVQQAVRSSFDEVTGVTSPGYGIDGCSAPNFATSLRGLATAMARFAAAKGNTARGQAMVRLRQAMAAHPDLVAGEGRACTELMRAMGGEVAIKTGAEGVFVAMLPARGLGVALKIVDGATRASECAIVAILSRLGALDPEHPAARKRMNAVQRNWRGIETGILRPAPAFPA